MRLRWLPALVAAVAVAVAVAVAAVVAVAVVVATETATNNLSVPMIILGGGSFTGCDLRHERVFGAGAAHRCAQSRL